MSMATSMKSEGQSATPATLTQHAVAMQFNAPICSSRVILTSPHAATAAFFNVLHLVF
jgi:hypothetical protein